MILVLDIGNSQVYGGVFDDDRLALQFRRTTRAESTSDEIGLFCRQVLRENAVDPAAITAAAITRASREARPVAAARLGP